MTSPSDPSYMRLALRLAQRAYGHTSPNPLVGAVIVRKGRVIGRGWHHRAGQPHAEIEALRDAQQRGHSVKDATIYITLEPCSTHGRTPPCTDALIASGVKRVVIGAVDPNPRHQGHGLPLLQKAGLRVTSGLLAEECTRLNESFNHWIVHRTPFVTVKAAMTLDGKIATATGESKWITGEKSRAYAMHLRQGSDAILVGVNTILFDNPSLTIRLPETKKSKTLSAKNLRRLILDPSARTPLTANVIADAHAAHNTTIIVTDAAPAKKIAALSRHVRVLIAPGEKTDANQHTQSKTTIQLGWLMQQLGVENITSLLVEGGGETNALFLQQNQAHRIAFFYAPKILGATNARKAISGDLLTPYLKLTDVNYKQLGDDLLMQAHISQLTSAQ